MNNLKSVRKWLNVTQGEIADGIGCTAGNVGHYERGQTLPPEMARKLITFATSKGLQIGFDHIYGAAELPERPDSEEKAPKALEEPA